jgi:hypothetical protein
VADRADLSGAHAGRVGVLAADGQLCVALFSIPPELWFATDRDLTKKTGLPKKEKVRRGRAKDEEGNS